MRAEDLTKYMEATAANIERLGFKALIDDRMLMIEGSMVFCMFEGEPQPPPTELAADLVHRARTHHSDEKGNCPCFRCTEQFFEFFEECPEALDEFMRNAAATGDKVIGQAFHAFARQRRVAATQVALVCNGRTH